MLLTSLLFVIDYLLFLSERVGYNLRDKLRQHFRWYRRLVRLLWWEWRGRPVTRFLRFLVNKWYNLPLALVVYTLCYVGALFSAIVSALLWVSFLACPGAFAYVTWPKEPALRDDMSLPQVLIEFCWVHFVYYGWARGLYGLPQFYKELIALGDKAKDTPTWVLLTYALVGYFLTDVTVNAHIRGVHAIRAIDGYQRTPQLTLAYAWLNYHTTELSYVTWTMWGYYNHVAFDFFFDGPLPEGLTWINIHARRRLINWRFWSSWFNW